MHRNAGFTLIELMITVAIVALLAGVAYPSYRNQVLKSHRAEGKSTLMQVAQNLERCYTATNPYVGCAPSPTQTTWPLTSEHGRYQISITSNATTYTLTATPQAGQANDTRCMNLTLTETGAKNKSGTGTVRDCW
ncbi:MAG TPA: type IV pilin protein [Povalibacter sp.]|nr:type IV pilin protein [Povalibacter sp.]